MLTEDEEAIRSNTAQWVDEVVKPRVQDMDKEGEFHKEVLSAMFEQGLMGIEVPAEYDGLGANFTSCLLAVEEIAKVDPSLAVMMDIHNTLLVTAFNTYGTEAQKKQYLSRLATDTVGSFCISEPGSGSDAFALKMRARRDGDDWIINGRKSWISNSKEAGIFLVFANAAPEEGFRGITAFVVERDTPGLEIGKKEDKLGIRASSTCDLLLDDCRVPNSAVLGKVGEGYKVAISLLNEGRIGIGAQMVGLAQGAFDYALSYMATREQFGKPIIDFQGMEFQYARAKMEIEAARLMVYNAARLKEAKQPFVMEAAAAKLKSSEVAQSTASQCIDWLGGVGFTREYLAEKYYRDSKIGTIYEGTSNIQLATMAKILKGAYK